MAFWQEFIAIANRYPDNIAIRDNGLALTYADLRDRAAGVGRQLTAQGVGLETPVALRMEKSAEYILGLLGIWHAGAAFVPLPPSLPQERQDYIAAEAKVRHFLDQKTVDAAAPAVAAPVAVQPETLAYIIYTSGSTGKPKGVMVEHRGIVNLCAAQRKAFRMNAASKSLFYLSVNFDASVSDICVALLAGSTLVIRPQAELQDGVSLKRVLKDEAITHMDVPPSLLKMLSPGDMPKSLETIIIGGEAASAETVRSWAARFRVVNVYGPTEATVCTSLNICTAAWELPLLGEALPGVTYKIIGDELHIGGNVLARGYLNQPELTAQKFIMLDGERFYKTGDRVHLHPDGSLEFLGRIDRQFKLRGQLVEPDEVEARLRAHPQVMKAAVIKREGRLVAFIAVSDPTAVTGLAEWLARFLPLWMIPQHFEVIGRLPLTAAGKTDYAQLAALRLNSDVARREPPRNAMEQSLWNIWRAVLKHEDFGVTDAFYAVGGDSLGIIRLTLEAERQGLSVSPSLFSGHATIEAQAKHAGGASSALAADWLRKDVAFTASDRAMMQTAAKRAASAPTTKDILLTGATGFLGSRVLSELLTRTDAKIHCIVRATDASGALTRIREAVAKFRVPFAAKDWARIVAIPGDLSLPQAGLDDAVWKTLTQNIDAIYHCAACVNMVLSYPDMRAANVGSGLTLLRLACEGKRKPLHNASTLSVFVATDKNRGTLLESDRLDGVTTVYGGYAQTKFAAEHMLSNVPAGAADVFQYRFGLLTGAVDTGASSPTDFLALFAKGIARLGAVPEGFGEMLKVDVTPICHAARAMVSLSLSAKPGVYHIANSKGLSLNRLCDAITRNRHTVRKLPASRWLDLVKNKPLTPEESAAVLSLCRVFPDEAGFDRRRTMDLFQATDVSFDMTQASAAGITCPETSDALLDTYLNWFFRDEKRVVKICLFGPESTGKSTLAKNLAQEFSVPFAAEYAHEHITARKGTIELADIPKIAAGQVAAEAAAEGAAKALMFCDTDLLTTVIWSEKLFRECPQWIRDAAELQQYDLYLLMDIDTPWVADVHRYLPQERQSFLDICRETLETHQRPYMMLSGSWEEKLNAASAAVTRLTGSRQEKAA